MMAKEFIKLMNLDHRQQLKGRKYGKLN
ncbi:hypothetical protein BDFB_011905 [Asbolus verrucosus]|uniref:Uncharacterized protein n=1 Tax=Asbolus verrucosus TaxID=1661398 RepID=A0A482W4A4_ASBVE|nr:hypothetical protein BDFB_011905 [Asbolus verrucosus]